MNLILSLPRIPGKTPQCTQSQREGGECRPGTAERERKCAKRCTSMVVHMCATLATIFTKQNQAEPGTTLQYTASTYLIRQLSTVYPLSTRTELETPHTQHPATKDFY